MRLSQQLTYLFHYALPFRVSVIIIIIIIIIIISQNYAVMI